MGFAPAKRCPPDAIAQDTATIRACFRIVSGCRVRARGLQEMGKILGPCRPGPLPGRFLKHVLRACFKIRRGPVFAPKAAGEARRGSIPAGGCDRGATKPAALGAKTLRAAALLALARVGSFLTARCGDARNSPPWPPPKSLAAGPLLISKQALRANSRRLPLFNGLFVETVGRTGNLN